MTSRTYWDADGVRHEVAVRETADGDWQVLDTSLAETRIVETLDGTQDDRAQAEAVARDYLTAGRFTAAGRDAAERIPEQGGADAHSNGRPHPEAGQQSTSGPALSRQAG
jgi:hypothetical protein